MVYNNNFVVCVKVNGKIIREKGSWVDLPFGTEYTILLKNLDSRRSLASVEIDGQDVLDGSKLIINGSSCVELEGFTKGNKVTNRFKFIEKTQEISDYRGDKAEDGLIKVEVQYEKTYSWFNPVWYTHYPDYKYDYTSWLNNNLRVFSGSKDISISCYLNSVEPTGYVNDAGITVKGSDDVNQSFIEGSIGSLESGSHVIIIMLRGRVDNNPIQKIATTSDTKRCSTCGKKNKSSYKYCTRCGTFLE